MVYSHSTVNKSLTMLAARMPWARTCICCREMEVGGPAGGEAEVNAVGLMTDSSGSTAPATWLTYTYDLCLKDMET